MDSDAHIPASDKKSYFVLQCWREFELILSLFHTIANLGIPHGEEIEMIRNRKKSNFGKQ